MFAHRLFEDFFEHIRGELDKGYGFVPLIGAGISAGSGVPLIREIQAYLNQCMLRVFGIAHKDDKGKRRWNPQTDTWPPFQDLRAKDAEEAFQDLAKHINILPTDDDERQIAKEALGSLSDWRSTLLFLSRMQLDKTSKKIKALSPPNNNVVDRFFTHIHDGKRPSLAHYMFAQLAEPLRFDILLTTNFDRLLEEAFKEVGGQPPNPVAVHLDAGLPSKQQIRNQLTLVKLHGDSYGLRADYSVDMDTTLEERELFRGYFFDPIQNRSTGVLQHNQNHGIVFGTSGYERRIIELFAWLFWERKSGDDPKFRVYWVHFTESDATALKETLKWLAEKYHKEGNMEIEAKSLGDENWQNANIVLIKHEFQDLFLLQLYQAVTLTLPAHFAPFTSSPQLAVPPAQLTQDQVKLLNQLHIDDPSDRMGCRAIKKEAERLFKHPPTAEDRIIRITAGKSDATPKKDIPIAGGHGVLSAGIHHFYRALAKGKKCIWLALDSISSADELYEHITEAIARAAGRTDWLPIVLYEQRLKTVAELSRLTQGRSEWVIFLDARDGAGSDLEDHDLSGKPNGWLDNEKKESDSKKRRRSTKETVRSAAVDDFINLLKQIAGFQCSNLSVVLLYHALRKESKDKTILHTHLEEKNCGKLFCIKDGAAFVESMDLDGPSSLHSGSSVKKDDIAILSNRKNRHFKFRHADACKMALGWVGNNKNHRRFLLGLVCSQKVRYPVMLLDDAFWLHSNIPLEERRKYIWGTTNETLDGWLDELIKRCVIRILPGGFVWMHAETKSLLRNELESRCSADERYEVHRLHGEWYERLFASSGDALAGLEAVYHYLQAAQIHVTEEKDAQGVLAAALRVMRQAERPALIGGYPKATCRCLVRLRQDQLQRLRKEIAKFSYRVKPWKTPCLRLIDELVLQTLHVARAVAREVSENARAYFRHDQYLEYLAKNKLTEKLNFEDHDEIKAKMDEPKYRKPKRKDWFKEKGLNHWRNTRLKTIESYKILREYMRWRRQWGIISLATRGYLAAFNQLAESIQLSSKFTEINRQFTKINLGKKGTTLFYKYKHFDVPTLRRIDWEIIHAKTELKRGVNAYQIVDEVVNDLTKSKYSLIENSSIGFRNIREKICSSMIAAVGTKIKEIPVADLAQDKELNSEVLRALSRLVQCCVCYAEAMRFPCEEEPKEVKSACDLAVAAYNKFSELNSLLHDPHYSREEFYEHRHTMETQMSTIWAMKKQWKKAHDSIQRAVEASHRMDPLQSELGEGVVELHRAQLCLLQARDVSNPLANNDSKIIPSVRLGLRELLVKAYNDRVGGKSSEPSWWGTGDIAMQSTKRLKIPNHLFKMVFCNYSVKNKKILTASLNQALSYIDDAEKACHKAEALLVRKRKNVWWSTWLFEIQSKIVEYRLILEIVNATIRSSQASSLDGFKVESLKKKLLKSHGSESLDVPLFGSQAHPRGFNTHLDNYLKRTLRMVRLDMVRIARVVESYALCHWGLAVLLRLDPDYELLPTRQRRMRDLLTQGGQTSDKGAITILREKYDLRKRVPPLLDPLVAVYVESVLKFSQMSADATPVIE